MLGYQKAFDDATLDRAAVAFDNPDDIEVVLHSDRHRPGFAPGYPAYDPIEEKLAAQPAITVPAVTLDGLADGNFPATDGSPSARHFTRPRLHHQVPNAGHSLPGGRRTPSPARSGKWPGFDPRRTEGDRAIHDTLTGDVIRGCGGVAAATVRPR